MGWLNLFTDLSRFVHFYSATCCKNIKDSLKMCPKCKIIIIVIIIVELLLCLLWQKIRGWTQSWASRELIISVSGIADRAYAPACRVARDGTAWKWTNRSLRGLISPESYERFIHIEWIAQEQHISNSEFLCVNIEVKAVSDGQCRAELRVNSPERWTYSLFQVLQQSVQHHEK